MAKSPSKRRKSTKEHGRISEGNTSYNVGKDRFGLLTRRTRICYRMPDGGVPPSYLDRDRGWFRFEVPIERPDVITTAATEKRERKTDIGCRLKMPLQTCAIMPRRLLTASNFIHLGPGATCCYDRSEYPSGKQADEMRANADENLVILWARSSMVYSFASIQPHPWYLHLGIITPLYRRGSTDFSCSCRLITSTWGNDFGKLLTEGLLVKRFSAPLLLKHLSQIWVLRWHGYQHYLSSPSIIGLRADELQPSDHVK